MWGIQSVKELAISQIFHGDTAVNPLTKVILARDYGLTEELLPSLTQFTQWGLVRAEEVNSLGLDYFLKILEIQESKVRVDGCPQNGIPFGFDHSSDGSPCGNYVDPHNRQNCDFTKSLQSIFQEEIQRLDGLNETVRVPERAYNPAVPVHLGGPKKDDRFFPVNVFFLVSRH